MLRGNYQNLYWKFEKEWVGMVVFLGGFIIEMKGWWDMICEDLKQCFFYIKFIFVVVGIFLIGSIFGVFCLMDDVLFKGKVDLFFVEVVVNDDINGFSVIEQVRGMEGIVWYVLVFNLLMDIMMLYFIYDFFILKLDKGQMFDVILNYEWVVNYYLFFFVNFVFEIVVWMWSGEFIWEQFGGIYFNFLGYVYYVVIINKVFDEMYVFCVIVKDVVKFYVFFVVLLDVYSYINGRLVDIW